MAAAGRRRKVEEVVPAADRTVNSLRDIGYELPQAVADLVDNSIEAGARAVDVDVVFDGAASWVRIADNGSGMDMARIKESLRIGSVRDYDEDDLGKFGFGMKTASLSQCRRLVVASRVAPQRARIEARVFDVQHIEDTNRWEVLILDPADRPAHLTDPLQDHPGTVILWENLDRVLTYRDPSGGWARNHLLGQTELIAEHLAMVFHRFLSGSARGRQQVEIRVNGSLVEPWNPFCPDEDTRELEAKHFPVTSEGAQGIVLLRPFVLPGQAEFSTQAAWQRASGPRRWNNQQGLYVYRADRLIQWGGWSRLRTRDEHTKLARVALEFSPELDSAFGINISKARVNLPADLREAMSATITQVCSVADKRYRSNSKPRPPRPPARLPAPPRPAPPAPTPNPPPTAAPVPTPTPVPDPASTPVPGSEGVLPRTAFEQAADAAGQRVALDAIVQTLQAMSPEVAHELGW
ncbi:hypothetical protein QE364_000787 [Nocardioides zeae]|uniref:Uncharacterized protein n=1 Tax=Nocardioides zeae TaxID=1457234 RepID=A0ACC6IEL5_9ACTN|nr:ATP-binding protein [Nocardioides zeae]MDR6174290.1 hypothetical protein [Nocardioides zeae]MDR6209095.1 hypothetical protein [Nocardioides zeae]